MLYSLQDLKLFLSNSVLVNCDQLEFIVESIFINSKEVKKNSIFLALIGQKHDGHNFIDEAVERGASVIIINKSYWQNNIDHIEGLTIRACFIVDDTYEALKVLSECNRKRYKGTIIGITGSVGKTTTKELLAKALAANIGTYMSRGNYNNEIGLPLCLANLDIKTEVAVFELGMNGAGEILRLSRLLKPHIAIITEVCASHTDNFESLVGVADAKLEILDGLVSPRIFIMNGDSTFKEKAILKAKSLGVSMVYTFGQQSENDFQLMSCKQHGIFGQDIEFRIFSKQYSLALQTFAVHHGLLVTLVMGCIELMGLNQQNSLTALASFKGVAGRGLVHNVQINKNNKIINYTLIDDSYNANPKSMRDGILGLSNINYARKMAVLGDMLGLNPKDAVIEHMKILEYIKLANFDIAILLGEKMELVFEAYKKEQNTKLQIYCCRDVVDLKNQFMELVQDQDIVFAKASFYTGLNVVVGDLLSK